MRSVWLGTAHLMGLSQVLRGLAGIRRSPGLRIIPPPSSRGGDPRKDRVTSSTKR